jgi:hypothetical protein
MSREFWSSQVAGRIARRSGARELAEGVEPGLLRERGKTGEGVFGFDSSRYIEMEDWSMTASMTLTLRPPAALRAGDLLLPTGGVVLKDSPA